MLRPKTRSRPPSGRIRPAPSRSSTVLPEPLPPMMTRVSPLVSVNDTPFKTSFESKFFLTSTASTMPSAIVLVEQRQEELGEEEVRDDDGHGHVDDRGRRC